MSAGGALARAVAVVAAAMLTACATSTAEPGRGVVAAEFAPTPPPLGIAATPEPTALAIAAASATSSHGPTSEIEFYPPGTVGAIEGEPSALAGGDLDGDGVAEAVVAARGTDTVAVVRNDGALDHYGNDADMRVRSYPGGGRRPVAVAVGELTGDRHADVAVVNTGSDGIAVLAGVGDGRLRAPVVHGSGGGRPVALAVSDLDGDGRADLVVANAGSGDIGILRADGHGGFYPAEVVDVGGEPVAVVVTDVDGDSRSDAVLADAASDRIVLLRGDGAGGFAAPVRSAAGVRHPRWLTTADLEGDGRGDIGVGSPEEVGIAILRGTPSGLGKPVLVQRDLGGDKTVARASGVALGLLDADAHPDLAVVDAIGRLWLFRGDAHGRLEPVGYEDTHDVRRGAVALVDLNGDGASDVLTAGKGGVGIAENMEWSGCAGPPPPRAIVGTPADDVLIGTPGRDFIFGLAGADVIRSGVGAWDVLCGGPGDDTIHGGAGDDAMWGGPGNDRLYGGQGEKHPYGNNNAMYGEDGDDLLVAGGSENRMEGGPGDDVLRSTGGGEGVLIGGPGEDEIIPGPQDTVFDADAPPGHGRH